MVICRVMAQLLLVHDDAGAVATLQRLLQGHALTVASSVEEALASVPADARVLIFGSLYLAGAVLAANDQVPT